MTRIIEVPTFANIPAYVPFGVLYLAQDTNALYIGTGNSVGASVVSVVSSSTLATSAAFPTAAVTAPSPVGTSAVPAGENPIMWVQDANGTYQTAAYVDTATTWAGESSKGNLSFCRPVLFNKTGIDPNFSANGALAVFAQPSTTADTVAVQIQNNMALGDTNTYNGQILGIYAEVDINGTPTMTGGNVAGQVGASPLRGTLQDNRGASNTSAFLYGVSAAHFRLGAGQTNGNPGNGAFFGWVSNGNTATAGGGQLTVYCAGGVSVGGATGCGMVGYQANVPSTRFPSYNVGFYCQDYGTNANDWCIQTSSSGINSGACNFGGPVVLGAHGVLRTARSGGSAPGNTDGAGKLVFAAATTATYTFTETYAVAPMVFIQPDVPGAITFTISAISNTAFTVTASGAFTGNVSYMTIGRQ